MIMDADTERQKETKRAAAYQFLKEHRAGVLASASPDGKPHASVVYYTSDERFSIYFITLASSRKYQALKANPWGAFVVGTLDMPQTLQIEGPIVELRENDDKGKHLSQLLENLTSNAQYFAPITKMDPADMVVMWLEAKWIRWADYAQSESGNEHVFTELNADQSFVD